MTQTWAIFLEAYRNLNSKKLFWLVLIFSGLIAAAFACVGVNQGGLKIAFWQLDNDVVNAKVMPPEQFYKSIFVQIGIGVWLSWLATILALISTSGIFPDLLTNGSIDLYISKPISRLRLFLTEYMAGLLFVTLQVAIFSVACFLIIGLRGGVWEPGLFLAVPVLVCFFSYLFSVCVLLGVLTRSTVASLLLTLLFWFGVWSIGTAENALLMFKTMHQKGVDFAAVQAEKDGNKPTTGDKKEHPTEAEHADQNKEPAPEATSDVYTLDMAHRIVYSVETVLPKTSETINLLQRWLIRFAKLGPQPTGPQTQRMQAAQQEFIEIIYRRSIAWIIGTSLGFEAVMLLLAAWVFCRRDY